MKHLAIVDPRAAFVDVGSEHMHVSVAGDEPAVFGTVTSPVHALRDWLKSQGVRSVAMEATGVYWLPLFGVLEAAGFDVRMVNGRQTRNLPGQQDRHAGLPMGRHAPCARTSARRLRTARRHSPTARLLASACGPRRQRRDSRAAYAEGARAHEHQAARRD